MTHRAGPFDPIGLPAVPGRRIQPTPRRRRGLPRLRWLVGVVLLVGALVAGALWTGAGPLDPVSPGSGGNAGPAQADATRATPGRRCEGEPAAVTVVASPDHAEVLADLAERWTEEGAEVDGRCVTARVAAREPARTAAALGGTWDPDRDGPRPDVWAPDSSAWVQAAAARPAAAALLPAERPSTARSPVVLAMPRPMAEALRWPQARLGWRDLLGRVAAAGPRGWSAYGHREWGPIQLGMTDPARSTAGLHALMAVTDPDGDGRSSDVELRNGVVLERATTRYAADTPALLARLADADRTGRALSYVSAFPALERDVLQYNARGPVVPLAAVHPPEGTADADHPWLVLRAPWVDEQRRRAAASFLAYVQGGTGRAAYAQAGFRGADGAPVPGSDRGVGEPGAAAVPARQVRRPEQVLAATATWQAFRRRANVQVVADVSGSMKDPVPGTGTTKLRLVQAAAGRAIAQLSDETKVATWEFSERLDGPRDYRRLVPFGPLAARVGGVTRRQATVAALQGLRPRTATGLYDTTLAAYAEAQRTWEPGRLNLVVLLTDGRNEDARGLTRPQLITRLRQLADPRRPVQVVTVAYGADADVGVLREISAVTGGRAFVSRNPADIDRVLLTVQLAVLLRR